MSRIRRTRSWRPIGESFPALFKPFGPCRRICKKNIRYPEDLFHIQAQVYRAYHMDDPDVFYNREDLWQFPRQEPLDAVRQRWPRCSPTTLTCACPARRSAEFFVMLPMVPSKRRQYDRVAGRALRRPDYGKLIVYAFPKENLVFGPSQIEARINQDTAISQQIPSGTRWARG